MEEIVKKPVLGRAPVIFRAVFLGLFAVCTALFAALAVNNAQLRRVYLIIMAGGDVIFLLLAYIIPTCSFFGNYSYALSGGGISLYRREERVMEMKWEDTDVSIGSYIRRGSEKNPSVCAKAICFTRKGAMRQPPRFPKRALKGAGGELCISYSRSRLRDVFSACGGGIAGEVSADGCRLPLKDAEVMNSALKKLKTKQAADNIPIRIEGGPDNTDQSLR